MISLTPQQQRLLAFLKAKIEETGVSPTFQEMASALDLSSKSGIQRILSDLELRGRIRRLKNKARAIEIIDGKCPHCGKSL